jgi:hypothetical protein
MIIVQMGISVMVADQILLAVVINSQSLAYLKTLMDIVSAMINVIKDFYAMC